jgi:hypothetical protein
VAKGFLFSGVVAPRIAIPMHHYEFYTLIMPTTHITIAIPADNMHATCNAFFLSIAG